MQKSQAPRATLLPGEAARILGVTTTTLATWADAGRVEFIRLPSGHRRYFADSVARLAAQVSAA
jgi:predicted site-specific integrase-resolvase